MYKSERTKSFNPAIRKILEISQRKAKELQRSSTLKDMEAHEQKNRILWIYYNAMDEITGEYIRHCQRLNQRGVVSIQRDRQILQVEFKKLLDNSTRRLWDSLQEVFNTGGMYNSNNLYPLLEKHEIELENQVKRFLQDEQSKQREDLRVTRKIVKIPIFRKALALIGLIHL